MGDRIPKCNIVWPARQDIRGRVRCVRVLGAAIGYDVTSPPREFFYYRTEAAAFIEGEYKYESFQYRQGRNGSVVC